MSWGQSEMLYLGCWPISMSEKTGQAVASRRLLLEKEQASQGNFSQASFHTSECPIWQSENGSHFQEHSPGFGVRVSRRAPRWVKGTPWGSPDPPSLLQLPAPTKWEHSRQCQGFVCSNHPKIELWGLLPIWRQDGNRPWWCWPPFWRSPCASRLILLGWAADQTPGSSREPARSQWGRQLRTLGAFQQEDNSFVFLL